MSKKQYKDKDWLMKQYTERGLSTTEIADKTTVTCGTINHWLKKHDIETRSISESIEGRTISDEQRKKISKSVSEHLEENGHPFEGESHTEASKKKMSEANSGKNNPNYGKDRPEHSERMSGSSNPSYKDGRSENRDFRSKPKWEKFSFELKEGADWTCENCGAHGSDSEIQTHHAHPVSEGGDKYDNVFIILCKSCHGNTSSFWHNSTTGEQIAEIGGEPVTELA